MVELIYRWRREARAVLSDPHSPPLRVRIAWAFLRQHGATT